MPVVVGEMLDWWRFYLLQDVVTLLVNAVCDLHNKLELYPSI